MPREYAEGDFGTERRLPGRAPHLAAPQGALPRRDGPHPIAALDAFAANEARWLLTLHAANLLHAARTPRFGMARLYATTAVPPERAGTPAAQRVQATLPLAGYPDRSSPASTACR